MSSLKLPATTASTTGLGQQVASTGYGQQPLTNPGLGQQQPVTGTGYSQQPLTNPGLGQQMASTGYSQQPQQLASTGYSQQPQQLASTGYSQQPQQFASTGYSQQPQQLASTGLSQQLASTVLNQPRSSAGLIQPLSSTGLSQQLIGQQLSSTGLGQQMLGQQLMRTDRSMLSMSDDNVLLKQVLQTHTPDGREVEVKPLLRLIEDILNRATHHFDIVIPTNKAQEEIEDKVQQMDTVLMFDALSLTIDRISSEISYKALSGSDAHGTTLSIFNLLGSYPWDAKLVLTMAAFSLNYGEFWLLAQIQSTNQLAKSMAILRQLNLIFERSGPLKPRFDALNKLIKAMLDVTKCVVEFKDLPPVYFSQEVPAFSAAIAHIPAAVYWTIRSVVACSTQIANLSAGHELGLSTSETWELSTAAHKLNNIHDHLRMQLNACYQHIDDRRNVEAYQMLLNLFETIHIDNMKILKALIYAKDDIQPLVDGTTKRRVSIEVLRRKNVLLLISNLDFFSDELSILEQIYNESRMHTTRLESQYEVVWIPVVDPLITWNENLQSKFENLQSTMPWYTVYHPSVIGKPVIQFIKDKWHFGNKPILVVLDPQGRVVSPNAIHMMWIWGSTAFPFTSLREEALWKDETWRLELLVDGIDPTILTWIRDGKYIFVYGGDDIEWIRKFTSAARALAQAARIPLEMIYVGKSTKREQVRRVMATITVEKLSSCWPEMSMIWFFWARLESMLFSKIQLGKLDDHDLMIQEIKRLHSYGKEGAWAVLSKGSNIVVNGHGTTVLPTLLEYDIWKEYIATKGFDLSFKDHHDKLHSIAHPCYRFELPSTAGRIPEAVKCPECHRNMLKHTTFICCHDESVGESLLF